MTKMIVFDLDGTLANLYKVNNWLEKLRALDPSPYADAAPIYSMVAINRLITSLKAAGFRIAVTSWLSKESTPEYDAATRKAKREWLEKYSFPYDEIHLVKYGTPKAKCTRGKADFQILVDDNAEVRASWTLGPTIDATKNIMDALSALIKDLENFAEQEKKESADKFKQAKNIFDEVNKK